jgi:hypothetical protein
MHYVEEEKMYHLTARTLADLQNKQISNEQLKIYDKMYERI